MTRIERIKILFTHLDQAAVRVQAQLVHSLKAGEIEALPRLQELDRLVAYLKLSIEDVPNE